MPNGIPKDLVHSTGKGMGKGSSENSLKALEAGKWKPGQSGNPGGRSKKKPITEIFEKIFEDKGNVEKIRDSIIETLLSRGIAKVLLIEKMADRIEGKIKDEMELTVREGLAEQVAKFRKKKAIQDEECE